MLRNAFKKSRAEAQSVVLADVYAYRKTAKTINRVSLFKSNLC